MDVFVARQPIFDRRQKVFAYELLYRSSKVNQYQAVDGDAASLGVILDGIHGMGLETLTSGRKAFINFTGNLLVQDVAQMLPKEKVVVEILEDVKPDANLLERCKELKRKGYMLALDDFCIGHGFGELVDIADIIKVDYMTTNYGSRLQILRDYSRPNLKFLAEKVETKAEFDEAHHMGFTYFQGYFFSKPVIIQGKDIAPSKLNHMELLKQIHHPEPDFIKISNIIERDVALSYKLLRIINSAAFGFRKKVSSIQQAIVAMGLAETKKWVSLFALKGLGSSSNEEVVYTSLLRAKMMEIISLEAGFKEDSSEFFMIGLFSMIDVLLNKPMNEITEMMPLSNKVKQSLLRSSNQECSISRLVSSYERGNWDQVVACSMQLKLRPERIPEFYKAAVKWIKAIDE